MLAWKRSLNLKKTVGSLIMMSSLVPSSHLLIASLQKKTQVRARHAGDVVASQYAPSPGFGDSISSRLQGHPKGDEEPLLQQETWSCDQDTE